MKVSCNQESLAKQLAIVGRLVSSKPGLPILANVLLETEDSKLKMTATDLEIGVHTWIGADVKEDGKITIPARTFSEFINSLPADKVDIKLDKHTVDVKTTNNEAQFNTLPSDDFPDVPGVVSGDVIMKIDPEELEDAVNKVAFAAASDDSRPVLTGIKMEAENDDLKMIAVDGFRLSRKLIKLEQSVEKKLDLLVPAKALQELARVISDLADEEEKKSSERVEVYMLENKNQVIFRYREVDLVSRLIDGKFPEYKQIIPTGFKTNTKMSRDDFQNAVRIVNIFARNVIGNKAIVEFNPEVNEVKVSASLAEIGENESSFNSDVDGEKLKIGFSSKFLTDMISSIDGDVIVFEGSSPTAPGAFKSVEDDTFLHIIMPMRLS
jgi:DNA polymerase-3 subunit beta